MSENKSIYGLIGYPVEHSLSPLMHNAAFDALEIEAIYKLFPLKEKDLDGFFSDLRQETNPIFGLNVTVPYKENVLKYLDSFSPYVQKIKAVNTIVVTPDRKLIGQNTDGPGFLTHLQELNVRVAGKRIAVIGAGGVARAIIAVLCLIPERPAWVKLFDIEKGKTEALVSDLRNSDLDVSILHPVHCIDDLGLEIDDILINATPVGMKKDDPVLVEEELLTSQLFVYDVIYNPAETRLLRMAKEKGSRYSNGLGMLFYQGVLAFEHWAGQEIAESVKEKMKRSLTEGLKSL